MIGRFYNNESVADCTSETTQSPCELLGQSYGWTCTWDGTCVRARCSTKSDDRESCEAEDASCAYRGATCMGQSLFSSIGGQCNMARTTIDPVAMWSCCVHERRGGHDHFQYKPGPMGRTQNRLRIPAVCFHSECKRYLNAKSFAVSGMARRNRGALTMNCWPWFHSYL